MGCGRWLPLVLGCVIAAACSSAARDFGSGPGDGDAGEGGDTSSEGGAAGAPTFGESGTDGERASGGQGGDDGGGAPDTIGAGAGAAGAEVGAAGSDGLPQGGTASGDGGNSGASLVGFCGSAQGTSSSTLLCEDFEGSEPSPTLWKDTPAGFTLDATSHNGVHGLKITQTTGLLTAKIVHLPDPAHLSFWARVDSTAIASGGSLIMAAVDEPAPLPLGFVLTSTRSLWVDLRPDGPAHYSIPEVAIRSDVWLCYDLFITSNGQLKANVYDEDHTLLGTNNLAASDVFGADAGKPIGPLSFNWLHRAELAGSGVVWVDDILLSTDLSKSGTSCAH